jgi:hypothetical protein
MGHVFVKNIYRFKASAMNTDIREEGRARLTSDFILTGQQLQFHFLRQKVRIAEGDRAVLRFYEKGEKTRIGFHYYALTRFRFPASVGGPVKYPGPPVLGDLFPNFAQYISQVNHSQKTLTI